MKGWLGWPVARCGDFEGSAWFLDFMADGRAWSMVIKSYVDLHMANGEKSPG